MGGRYYVINISDSRSRLRALAAVNAVAQDHNVDPVTAEAIAAAVADELDEEGLVIVRRPASMLTHVADD